MKRFLIPLALCICACTNNTMPEISWSVMHPTDLDSTYMAKVLQESKSYHVDNIELCGGSNSGTNGSLDGLLMFEEYPLAYAAQDKERVMSNQANMKAILRMCHENGKEVYYWHREVLCNDGLIKSIPGLLDSEGEFDLFGKAYEDLLRYKISKVYEMYPDLDGIVLTLTEASFSALHSARPDIYPPVKVVEKIGGIFAEELKARGKRFILRSFGAVDEDYNAIMAGAVELSKHFDFEVETKITPYDFNPFLPDNKFLVHSGNCKLGAECDALGEFLGCGRMLPEDVDNIVRYVTYARKQKVDRYTIRIDRKYKNVFDTYPINLYAYQEAILHPEKSADDIRKEYYESRYPANVAEKLISMSKAGIDCVLKTVFIKGNLIFHWFPTTARLKFIKGGGILKVFASEGDLSRGCRQWAMLYQNPVPGRAEILKEKDEAVEIARENLEKLKEISSELNEYDLTRLTSGWENSLSEAVSIRELCRVICAYFDDMEARNADAPALNAAMDHLFATLKDIKTLRDIEGIAKLIYQEYAMEYALRERFDQIAADYVLTAAIGDQARTEHYMHGAFCEIHDGKPVSIVGNTVYPDGYVAVGLKGSKEPTQIYIEGKGQVRVNINGEEKEIDLENQAYIDVPACESGYEVSVRKRKGCDFPAIVAISILKSDFSKLIDRELDFALKQSMLMYDVIKPMEGMLVDNTNREGEFVAGQPFQWTAGFYPGTLWYLYENFGGQDVYDAAVEMTERMRGQQYNCNTHDIGFMMFCSFGQKRRVCADATCDSVIVNSAKSLASRFNPTTGCIRSWKSVPAKGWDYVVIIDNMMNLELLMEASLISGDSSYADIALTHANTTLKNHFRKDFSSYHVVNYDEKTGKILTRQTAQGLADESAWARGQGWALYGYTLMYRYTRDKDYLKQAVNIAEYLLNHPNMPQDGVPYWDFDAVKAGEETYRDVSAASIYASALIELSSYMKDGSKADRYRDFAKKIIVSLSESPYRAGLGENANFILKHSTINMNKGNYDTAVVYADYYYVEALMRYKKYLQGSTIL